MGKYEERWSGNFRELIVKSINKSDVGEYCVEARGTTQKAKLSITADKNQTTTALRSKAGPRKELVAEKKSAKVAAPKMTVSKVENTDAFSKTPTSIDGKDGGIEVFECTMKDASAPCDWYRNNKKIESANFSILKRRGSFSDQSKENAIFLALEKAKKSNKKWIRHPNYLNLWIMNSDYVAA